MTRLRKGYPPDYAKAIAIGENFLGQNQTRSPFDEAFLRCAIAHCYFDQASHVNGKALPRLQENLYIKAGEHLEEALKLKPRDPHSLQLKARMLTLLGKFDEARKIFYDMLGSHRDDTFVLHHAAEMELAAGNPQKAELIGNHIKALSEKISTPDTKKIRPLALLIITKAHMAQDNFEAAEATAREMLNYCETTGELKGRVKAYNFIAKALMGQNRFDKAEEVADKLLDTLERINFHEDALFARVLKAKTQLGQGKLEDVRITAQKLISLKAHDHNNIFECMGLELLATVFIRQKKFQLATTTLSRLSSKIPDASYTRILSARLKLGEEKYQEAFRETQQIMGEHPHPFVLRLMRYAACKADEAAGEGRHDFQSIYQERLARAKEEGLVYSGNNALNPITHPLAPAENESEISKIDQNMVKYLATYRNTLYTAPKISYGHINNLSGNGRHDNGAQMGGR